MGETVDDDGGATYLAYLKTAVNADDPQEVARWAEIWRSDGREMHEIAYNLNRTLEQLDGVFDTPVATPALRAKISEAIGELDDTGRRLARNGDLLAQSGHAIADAQDRINRITSTGPESVAQAQDSFDDLNEQNYNLAAQLDIFDERDDEDSGGRASDDRGIGPGGFGGDRAGGSGGGGGFLAPTPEARNRSAGRLGPRPALGDPTAAAGGRPGPGTGGTAGTRTGSQVGAGAGAAAGGRAARVGLPSARSGMPIGGYRPSLGSAGVAGGSTLPAGPGKPAVPGAPGRPGMVPPGGTAPGQPGRGRPGRRLTNYEKLEPNTFRATGHRTKPVIGEQRRQPDEFKPTPGAIGGKEAADETSKTPDSPTREAPMRFEGHDMSVSFNRSLRRDR